MEEVPVEAPPPHLCQDHSPSPPVAFAPRTKVQCTSAGNIVLVQKLSHLLLGLDPPRCFSQVDPTESLDIWAVALQDSSHIHRALPHAMQCPPKYNMAQRGVQKTGELIYLA